MSSATEVDFGGSPAPSFTLNANGSITAISPAGDVGGCDVTVTTPYGTSTTLADQFAYADIPYISGLSTYASSNEGLPVGGPLTGGTTVTISGADFSGATAVSFGGIAAKSFTVNSDGSIAAVSPAGAAGTVDVSVTNTIGRSEPSPPDQFLYAALPSIADISPTAGPITSGTQVTIYGTGLANALVAFGGVPGTVTSDSDTQIVVTTPYDNVEGVVLGPANVVVTTLGGVFPGTGGEGTVPQFTFVVTPSVSSIAASVGSVYGGNLVTITGSGLAGATAVDFGANPATIVSDSDSQLVVLSPEATGDTPGSVWVNVTTPGGTSPNAYTWIWEGSLVQVPVNFTYFAPRP